MTIKIYENTNASSYILKYTTDNSNTLELKKSTGVIPFSLPIVNTSGSISTSGGIVNEKTDFIHVAGAEATLSLSFEIGMNNINTMLDLVSNKVSVKHKVDIEDWSGETSGFSIYGIIDTIRIRQEGGDPRLNCDLSLLVGENPLGDMDGY